MATSITIGIKCIKPCPRTPQAWTRKPIASLAILKCKNGISFWGSKTGVHFYRTQRNSFAVYANNEPGDAVPSTPPAPPPPAPPSNPIGWILGLVMTLILPLKNRIMNAIQTVENVAEAVEGVAGKIDKMAEDFSDDLPEGKLRDFVESIEDAAERTAKAADCLDNVIDKVQEVEERLDDIIETAVQGAKGLPNQKN